MNTAIHAAPLPRTITPHPWGIDPNPAEWLVARLEEAGATLLALPRSGYTTALRTTRLDTLAEPSGTSADQGGRLRPAMPTSAAITRMDEAFAWLQLIPADRYLLRRILGARALLNPITGKHQHSWRRLGTLLGADHRAIQRWHAEGIALIRAALVGGGTQPHAPEGRGVRYVR